MNPPRPKRRSGPRRVAVVMNLEYALKRHQEVFAGAYRYAQNRGWQVDAMHFSRQIRSAGRSHLRYDGIIARADPQIAGFARAARVPLVNVWFSAPARNLTTVSADYLRAGRLAAEHLLARGLRRFAFAGYGRARSSEAAERGFLAGLAAYGERLDRFTTSVTFTAGAGTFGRFERSLWAWLDGLPRPVGVFVIDDCLARHLLNAALVRGIDVPGELAVVGLFNDEPFCLLAEPTLTSIDLGLDRVGFQAAKLLDQLMDGQQPPAGPLLLPPKLLIPRDSTDLFASDDELVARALRHMADHCHKPINVSDVVRRLGVCGRTLARRFRQARGCRPLDELTRMRITRAKRLLQERELPIGTVAAECGYASTNQFIVAFSRLEGITPGEFSRQASRRPRLTKAGQVVRKT